MKIKEVIVVEGRDDLDAVKKAVDAEIIVTHGYGITENTFKLIEVAAKKKGVIIFTDPDFAGEQIRKRIDKRIKGCKHAYLIKEDAYRKGDIGVENGKPDSIREALEKAKCSLEDSTNLFTKEDLVFCELLGHEDSTRKREALGKLLGIGYANGKQFLSRLNNYGITREQFANALNKIEKSRD